PPFFVGTIVEIVEALVIEKDLCGRFEADAVLAKFAAAFLSFHLKSMAILRSTRRGVNVSRLARRASTVHGWPRARLPSSPWASTDIHRSDRAHRGACSPRLRGHAALPPRGAPGHRRKPPPGAGMAPWVASATASAVAGVRPMAAA